MIVFARIAPYLWYPATMGVAIALFLLLLESNPSTLIPLYASISFVAVALLWLQRRYPARRAWRSRTR